MRPGRRCVSRLSSLRRVCAGGRVRPVMGERVWKRFHQQCKRVARSRPAVKGGAPPMGRAGHGGRSRTRSRKGGVERRGRGRCRGRGGPGLSGARGCSRTGETVGGLLRQVRGTRRVSGLDVSARSSWGGLWCGWGSWGEPGRGRVRICCKGVSRRDRPRAEARNINVSLPVLRLGPGLCNRFGQTAPPRAPARTAAAALAPTPGRRDVHFALRRAPPTAPVESDMRISTSTGPTRSHRSGRPRPHLADHRLAVSALREPRRTRPCWPPRTDPRPRTALPSEKCSLSPSHQEGPPDWPGSA